jgi:hypothetical protein
MEGKANRNLIHTYGEVFREKGIPPVGGTVRCRQTGTLWRIMEREVWQQVKEDPLTQESQIVPCFFVSFWRIEKGVPPGVGQMVGQLYTLHDDNFACLWEVLTFPEMNPTWLN